AITGSLDRELSGTRVVLLDEPLGCGNKIVKDILLLAEHARAVPRFPKLAPSAKVRNSEYTALFHPEGRRPTEERSLAGIETTVAGQQRRVGSVELQSLAVDEKHRNTSLVLRIVPDLLHLELVTVNGNLHPCPEVLFPARHVVAVNRQRSGERRETVEGFTAGPASDHEC